MEILLRESPLGYATSYWLGDLAPLAFESGYLMNPIPALHFFGQHCFALFGQGAVLHQHE